MGDVELNGGYSKTWTQPRPDPLTINEDGITSGGVGGIVTDYMADDCGGGTWAAVDSCGSVASAVVDAPPHTVIIVKNTNGYTASGVTGSVNWTASKGTIKPDNTSNPITVDLSGVDPCNNEPIHLAVSDLCGGRAAYQDNTIKKPDIVISGPDVWSGKIADYAASNAIGAVTWNTPTGCGTFSLTATDSCGRVGSKSVRMTSGKWQRVTSYTCNGAAAYYKYYTSGGTRSLIRGSQGPCGRVDAATGCYSVGTILPCNSSTTWSYSGPVDPFRDGSATVSSMPSCVTNGIGWNGSCFPSPGGYHAVGVCFVGCLEGVDSWVCP